MSKRHPKLIVRVCGGLGNQMFMYAFGLAASMRTGRQLYLDAESGFEGDFYEREFALDVFALPYKLAPRTACMHGIQGKVRRRFFRLLGRLGVSSPLYEESYPRHFESNLTESDFLASKKHYEGYWQSELYFRDYAQEIRDAFTLTAELSPETKSIAKMMHTHTAIGLHVRRLRTLPASGKIEELSGQEKQIPEEYYIKAIQKMLSGVENPMLFCFGDAPEWIKERLPEGIPYKIVDCNGTDKQAYQDLYLMQQCNKLAIANSSFSWWGGWLNRKANLEVYYPQVMDWRWQWNADLIPDHWLPIECCIRSKETF